MKIVKMIRSTPEVAGGPTTADVPESNIGGFFDAGWTLAEGENASNDEDDKDNVVDGKTDDEDSDNETPDTVDSDEETVNDNTENTSEENNEKENHKPETKKTGKNARKNAKK